MAKRAPVKQQGEVLFDPNTLTLAEAEDIESLTGLTIARFGEVLSSGSPPVKVLTAVTWIVLRRGDPTVTLEDVRNTPITTLGEIWGKAQAAAPPAANGSATSQRSSASTGG